MLREINMCCLSVVLSLVLLSYGVEGKGYTYPMVSYNQRICSSECEKWKPKHCWDGYLKRKVWKMVCEKYNINCCVGYRGPKCEEECFSCDKVDEFERRFIEIYGKIKNVNDTCYNSTTTIIHTGGGGKPDTEDKQECSCPAGPKGAMGPPGLPGSQGEPGQPGYPGRDGVDGDQGPPGIPGQPGLDGVRGKEGPRGLIGLPGVKGDSGNDGERGPAGLPGSAGTPGQKGESGTVDAGYPGERGPKGEPGINGYDGLPGERGPKGEPGLSGFPGISGTPGAMGPPGRQGIQGIKGSQGLIGLPGVDGMAGQPGLPGLDGRPGHKGDAGIPGIPGLLGTKGIKGEVGEPGNINEVFESRLIKELLNTVENLQTKLEKTTLEVRELKETCGRLTACEFNCTGDTYKCACGKCIPSQYRCDGFPHCPDGTDENPADCQYICNSGQFKCQSSGLCIPLEKRCNGIPDCPDDSDEGPTCTSGSCLEGAFPCRDGSKCVAREERCDGKEDCQDGSDEIGCDCDPGQFKCVRSGECIADNLLCDQFPDCDDESDESDDRCNINKISCYESQRPCKDLSACINSDSFCNGIKDCFDGSDEENCPGTSKNETGGNGNLPLPIVSSTTAKTTSPITTTTVKTTTPSTTAASTTKKSTTTTASPTEISTVEEELIPEGSGEPPELSCRELYDKWVDPSFPGGNPPPLSPNEEINAELCSYLRQQVLPSMSTRRKRHRVNDKMTDDEEMMMKDDPISSLDREDLSDLDFDESDDKKETFIIEFDKEPAAAAASLGSVESSAMARVVSDSLSVFLGLCVILFLIL